jgi:hypothetical protein
MTPEEVKLFNELSVATVAQRDVVVWLAQALAQQPAIDVTKLRADFLLGVDSLRQRKGLHGAWQEEAKMVEASLRLGASRRVPPLILEPPDAMI